MDIYKAISNARIGETWHQEIIPGKIMISMIKVGTYQIMIQYVAFVKIDTESKNIIRTTTTVTTIEAAELYESFEK